MADLADEMGGPGALGKLIGHAAGDQIGHMISGRRVISEKTMDAIESLPGRERWFYREGDARSNPKEPTVLASLRSLKKELERLPAAKRQIARVALKHFVDNPGQLLEVAQTLQTLSEPER